jgi:hypothetical protein
VSIVDVENHHLAPEPRGFLECPWRTWVIYHLAAEPRVLVDTTRTSGEWRLPDTSGKITVSTLCSSSRWFAHSLHKPCIYFPISCACVVALVTSCACVAS